MINPDVLVASQWWFRERNAHQSYLDLSLSTVFYFVQSLYHVTRNLSLQSVSGINSGEKKVSSSMHTTIGIFVSPENYANFRAVLSLVGDLYNYLELVKKYNLLELRSKIDQLYDACNKFRDVRNAFTHLGEGLINLEKHGVNGPLKTNCGIEYTETAKNCFHLIINDEKIYFTSFKKTNEIYVGQDAYNSIFDIARSIYAELTSHKLMKEIQTYEPVDSMFPI